MGERATAKSGGAKLQMVGVAAGLGESICAAEGCDEHIFLAVMTRQYLGTDKGISRRSISKSGFTQLFIRSSATNHPAHHPFDISATMLGTQTFARLLDISPCEQMSSSVVYPEY
jgi:hypothetical protein